MSQHESQVLLREVAVGKLWNSECQQAMETDHSNAHGDGQYRCVGSCGQHTASVDQVNSGLLWHYRGRRAGQTYGLSDDRIIDEMLSCLEVAWVRNGRIFTAQFD